MKKIKIAEIILLTTVVFLVAFYASKVLAGNMQVSFPDETKLQPVPLYTDPNISGNVNWPNDPNATNPDQVTPPDNTGGAGAGTGTNNSNSNPNNTGNTVNTNDTGNPNNTNNTNPNQNTQNNTIGTNSNQNVNSNDYYSTYYGNQNTQNQNPATNQSSTGNNSYYAPGTAGYNQNQNPASSGQQAKNNNQTGNQDDTSQNKNPSGPSNYIWLIIYTAGAILVIGVMIFMIFQSRNEN